MNNGAQVSDEGGIALEFDPESSLPTFDEIDMMYDIAYESGDGDAARLYFEQVRNYAGNVLPTIEAGFADFVPTEYPEVAFNPSRDEQHRWLNAFGTGEVLFADDGYGWGWGIESGGDRGHERRQFEPTKGERMTIDFGTTYNGDGDVLDGVVEVELNLHWFNGEDGSLEIHIFDTSGGLISVDLVNPFLNGNGIHTIRLTEDQVANGVRIGALDLRAAQFTNHLMFNFHINEVVTKKFDPGPIPAANGSEFFHFVEEFYLNLSELEHFSDGSLNSQSTTAEQYVNIRALLRFADALADALNPDGEGGTRVTEAEWANIAHDIGGVLRFQNDGIFLDDGGASVENLERAFELAEIDFDQINSEGDIAIDAQGASQQAQISSSGFSIDLFEGSESGFVTDLEILAGTNNYEVEYGSHADHDG